MLIYSLEVLPINSLILDKIDRLEAPNKIKVVMKIILNAEEDDMNQRDKRQFSTTISRILETYANDPEIIEFCRKK